MLRNPDHLTIAVADAARAIESSRWPRFEITLELVEWVVPGNNQG